MGWPRSLLGFSHNSICLLSFYRPPCFCNCFCLKYPYLFSVPGKIQWIFNLNVCFLCEAFLTVLIIFSHHIFWVPDIFCNASVSEPIKLFCNYLLVFLSSQLECEHSQCRDQVLLIFVQPCSAWNDVWHIDVELIYKESRAKLSSLLLLTHPYCYNVCCLIL